jgi:Asp-tRNA(Asn)/Glu-tRNA(Gln) amidotransferase A subunit family amidase
MCKRIFVFGFTLFLIGFFTSNALAQDAKFTLEEATVADIHAAMKSGKLTCRSLVEMYLVRIAAYDKKGPALNSILLINPKALEIADGLDKTYAKTGFVGPLHCIPTALKDNYDTADMPTTGGSKVLEKSLPPADGFLVKKLKNAGALILVKANMHELALSGTTVSSLGGQTLDPYDLTRTPGGSSGGTGVAIAANFAAIGMGSDTVNSIRSPASACNVVGVRPTKGLLSRAGIIPVSLTQDAAGPIVRTVTDAALMMDVMTGYDPADSVTAWSTDRTKSYASSLNVKGLKGARIGVLRTLFGSKPEHDEVNRIMEKAIEVMKKQGAVIIEVSDPALDAGKLNAEGDVQRYEFKTLFNNYLAGLGPQAPVKNLAEFLAVGTYHKPSLEKFLTDAQHFENPLNEPDYKERLLRNAKLQQTVMTLMADNRLDALVYPLQKRLVVPIGELNQADRNGILAALTGFPAINVPAGFSMPTTNAPLGVPVGLDFFGRPWSEDTLFSLAYSFEQATKYRRPPVSAPSLSR